jgi:hypothetical protein
MEKREGRREGAGGRDQERRREREHTGASEARPSVATRTHSPTVIRGTLPPAIGKRSAFTCFRAREIARETNRVSKLVLKSLKGAAKKDRCGVTNPRTVCSKREERGV